MCVTSSLYSSHAGLQVAAAGGAAPLKNSLTRTLLTSTGASGGGQWVSRDRQHLLFLHRLTPLPHQLLLSWFVPYLSSQLVGQHPNEVTSLTMSCDIVLVTQLAYVTSRSWFLGYHWRQLSWEGLLIGAAAPAAATCSPA